MIKRILITCAALFFASASSWAAPRSLKLVAPDYRPFTYIENNKVVGTGVDLVDKVFKELGTTYSVTMVPNYARALAEVTNEDADGLFLSSKSKERDDVADLSEKIAVTRWSWFLPAGSTLNPKDENFKKNAKIGTVMNSNQEAWLRANGFAISATFQDSSKLPALIQNNRADAYFVSESVFLSALPEKERSSFRQVVEVELPMGIYISKKYLKEDPGFMDRLNAAIRKVVR